jgi:hypothetical protein
MRNGNDTMNPTSISSSTRSHIVGCDNDGLIFFPDAAVVPLKLIDLHAKDKTVVSSKEQELVCKLRYFKSTKA